MVREDVDSGSLQLHVAGLCCVARMGESNTHPGWVLPYLGMVRRIRGDDPRFFNFQSDWVPML